MRELKQKEIKKTALALTVSEWYSQKSKLGNLAPEHMLSLTTEENGICFVLEFGWVS